MPANRPATDRTQSLRPLFSWMTSTPPRGFGASAHAACSSPLRSGPGDRRGRQRPCPIPAVGCLAAGALEVAVPVRRGRRFGRGLLLLAAGGDQRGCRRGAHPQQCQPAQRLASGQQAVDMVGGDFFGDVAL